MQNKLKQKLDKAQLIMIRKKRFVFLSTLLSKFNIISDEQIKNICFRANPKEIYINPEWFLSLTDEQASTALAHEILHYALQHDLRKGERCPIIYNIASDHVVNNLLREYGFQPLTWSDNKPPFEINKGVDEIYSEILNQYFKEELKKAQEFTSEYWNSDLWKIYIHMISELGNEVNEVLNRDYNLSTQDLEILRPDFRKDIIYPDENDEEQKNIIGRSMELLNASNQERMASGKDISDDGEFSKLFAKIKKGSIDWKNQLINYLNSKNKGKPDWLKLNRRLLSKDIYWRGNGGKDRINRISIAFDVSGSVSQQDIFKFLNEIKTIKNTFKPNKMDVVSFSHQIVEKWTFDESENLNELNMQVGGGTDLNPVFEHYSQEQNKPNFLIVFSDMEVDIPPKPDFKIIWVVVNNPSFKPTDYGKTIYINY